MVYMRGAAVAVFVVDVDVDADDALMAVTFPAAVRYVG
jgi:hypothetical protein